MSDITIKNIQVFLDTEKTLTKEETSLLNTIFQNIDKEDEYGNTLDNAKGDGKLNNSEWSLFKTALKTGYKNIYDKLSSYIKKTNDELEYDYFSSNKTIDPDMFTIEKLQKRFPDDKYNIEQGESFISITNKNTGDIVLDFFITDDSYSVNVFSENNKSIQAIYDNKNNKITSEDIRSDYQNAKIIYDYDQNVKVVNYQNIYDLQTGKAIEEVKQGALYQYAENGSFAKTNLDTGERTYFDKNNNVINEDINPEVFTKVIKKCNTKEELDALLTEKFSGSNAIQLLGTTHVYNLLSNIYFQFCEDRDEAKNVIKDLYNKALEQAENEGLFVDDLKDKDSMNYSAAKLKARYNSAEGELKDEPITKDSKFEQGITGNCWLLEKIGAMAQTDEGLEILNNMYSVQRNSDGSIKTVTVEIQGEKHTISIEEINGANELSSGNLYVRAIEIGVFKYLEKLGVEHTFGVQDQNFLFSGMGGGNSAIGSEILVGNGIEVTGRGSIKTVVDKTKQVDDNFMNELMNSSNAIIGVSTTKTGFSAYVIETGESENITSHHAYSVVRKDDNYIYLIEPSNNKKTLRMTYEEFKNCFEIGDITPINNAKNAIKNETELENENIEENKNEFVEHGSINIQYTIQQYQQMSKNPEEFRESEIQKLKTKLQEKFDPAIYNIDLTFDGRNYIYDITKKS